MLDALENAGVDLYADVGPSKDHWLNAGAGVGGVHYTMIFSKDGVRVEFTLAHTTKEKNKAMFDYLVSHRPQIEQAYGSALEWRRLDDNKVSMVVCSETFEGYEESNWPKMIAWLVEHIRRMERTFSPEIPALRQILRTQFSKASEREDADA
jgi:hypothetical protein